MRHYFLAFLSLASLSHATQTAEQVLANLKNTSWYSLQMENEEFKKFIQEFAPLATEEICKDYSFKNFISKHIIQDPDEARLKSLIPLIEKGLEIEWDTLTWKEETVKKFIQHLTSTATEEICKDYSFKNFISKHIIQDPDEDTLKSLIPLIEKGLKIEWDTLTWKEETVKKFIQHLTSTAKEKVCKDYWFKNFIKCSENTKDIDLASLLIQNFSKEIKIEFSSDIKNIFYEEIKKEIETTKNIEKTENIENLKNNPKFAFFLEKFKPSDFKNDRVTKILSHLIKNGFAFSENAIKNLISMALNQNLRNKNTIKIFNALKESKSQEIFTFICEKYNKLKNDNEYEKLFDDILRIKEKGTYLVTDEDIAKTYHTNNNTDLKKKFEDVAENNTRPDLKRKLFVDTKWVHYDYKKKSLIDKIKWNDPLRSGFEKEKTIGLYDINMPEYNDLLTQLTRKISATKQKDILEKIINHRFKRGMLSWYEGDRSYTGNESGVKSFYINKLNKKETDEYKKSNNFDLVQNDWTEEVKNHPNFEDWKTEKGSIPFPQMGLKASDNNPVGYYVYLPKNIDKPKALIIQFYGGDTKKDFDRAYQKYKTVGRFDQMLLAQGFAVAHLNLSDIWKNDTFQADMPQDNFDDVLKGIACFVDEVKAGKLLDLDKLKESKIFIESGSFGGAVIGRYLQEYNNVDGGIVSSPSLSSPKFKKYLDPIRNLKKINAPLLILATPHDNRIPFKNEVLDFPKAMKDQGLNTDRIWRYIEANDHETSDKSHYVGHFFPYSNTSAFRVILGFINGKRNDLVEIFREQTADILSAINNPKRTPEEVALLESYNRDLKLMIHKKYTPFKNGEISDDSWNQSLVFLFKNLFISEKKNKKDDLMKLIDLEKVKEQYSRLLKQEVVDLGFDPEVSENFSQQYAQSLTDQDFKDTDEFINILMRTDILNEAVGWFLAKKYLNGDITAPEIKNSVEAYKRKITDIEKARQEYSRDIIKDFGEKNRKNQIKLLKDIATKINAEGKEKKQK